MAKKALLDVLEHTIGRYVLNLDAESLNVALWSGKIELNSLELDIKTVNAELDRRAAEAPNLGLPFRVTSGQFSSFQVDVPWTHIMSRPVIMRAKGFKVSVEPHDRSSVLDLTAADNDTTTLREQRIRESRWESLGAADEYRQQTNNLRKLAEGDLGGSSSGGSQSSFGSRLVRRIIENIQVEISDVHISLESEDGSAGVVLAAFELVTTDASGRRTFVDRTSSTQGIENSFLFKALQIRGLGLYLDESESRPSVPLTSIQENETGGGDPGHSYILAPLSFDCKLRQADSNMCIDYPKYFLESQIQALSVLFSKSQLELARKVSEQISPPGGTVAPLFPQYRPVGRVTSANAKEWWQYAFRCIGRLNGKRAWSEFLTAFRKRNKYIPLYKRKAHAEACPWITPLTGAERAALAELEFDLSISIEGLMTWRNIADAQVDKEREKREASRKPEKGGLFTSLFGSSASAKAQQASAVVEEPPVALTVEELKQLEEISLDRIADAELSVDSRLCDIKFMLESLNINLASYNGRPMASLEMGTASACFDAMQDGSFTFDFALSSLNIADRLTPKSTFPRVLKSHITKEAEAFSIHASKSRTGDQVLRIRLSTFEAIASPLLLTELKRFVALSPAAASARKAKQNPMLAQSVSGSVDLFYDAAEGSMPKEVHVAEGTAPDTPTEPKSDFSSALIAAWKTKTEQKATWVVDFDIRAPILILPENCVDPRANVLVLDLGDLRLQYGQRDLDPKVSAWFKANPRVQADVTLDSALLSINDMTFAVGKVNYWRRLVRKKGALDGMDVDPTIDVREVYEPISLKLDFGVETSATDPVPRVCVFGVIPLIALNLSASQLSRMTSVSRSWSKVLKEMSPAPAQSTLAVDTGENRSRASLRSRASSKARRLVAGTLRSSALIASLHEDVGQELTLMFADMRLKRLSVKITNETGKGLEAHLVSVATSFSSLANGSSKGVLSMGWFWILDMLASDFPRNQRLVAHSTLPLSSEAFATNGKYDVLGELERIGAFEDNAASLKKLAHITFEQAGNDGFEHFDPLFGGKEESACAFVVNRIVRADFSSLYVNWNPRAVKGMTSELSNLATLIGSKEDQDVGLLILSSPAQLERRSSFSEASTVPGDVDEAEALVMVTVFDATMGGLNITLHSARDDFPLFLLKMSDTRISMRSSPCDTHVSLALDDLRVSTPATGKTHASYRTLLGLAPGMSDSLLSVSYFDGPNAMKLPDVNVDGAEFSAHAQVNLSPMKMVYIHAQVMALVEYSTEGILGALATKAASSAAAAAAELTVASPTKKLFRVNATGFEVVVPRAAYNQAYIAISTGELHVDYTANPAPGGGSAKLRLGDVLLSHGAGTPMQETPMRMTLDVTLPPVDVGSLEDQAMRIAIGISEAPFVLTKPVYLQLLATLSENVGETDLFLRDHESLGIVSDNAKNSTIEVVSQDGLTHSGVAAVDIQRRMYINFRILSLSLLLCSANEDDPLVRIAANAATINLNQIVDESRMVCNINLKDLACTDQRIKAIGRQNLSLVYQNKGESEGVNERESDVFSVNYDSQGNRTVVDLRIGSPRLVFIPDAVADILEFVSTKKAQQKTESPPNRGQKVMTLGTERVLEVETTVLDEEIEASFIKRDAKPVSSMAVSLKTQRCSLLLVDLGGASLVHSARFSQSSSFSAVSESLVLEGQFDAQLEYSSDLSTGAMLSMDTQLHGTEMESYTAQGRDLQRPLQVFEPSELSLYYAGKYDEDGSSSTDVRVAVLTPLDVAISMRNVALLNAIMASISESFEDGTSSESAEIPNPQPLSPQDRSRIERLANALESSADTASDTSGSSVGSSAQESSPGRPDGNETASASTPSSQSFKVTMPEAKITFINDLQGLDEALFRMNLVNMMASAQVRNGDTIRNSLQYTGFDCTAHATVGADYFDGNWNRWKPLLLKSWEITAKAVRGPSNRFKSLRPSTTFDIESFPCYMSFSEQFLASLGSAQQMWAIYSAATTSALQTPSEQADDRPQSIRLRRSIAASAARTLVRSLPYAVENHTGVSIKFVVRGASEQQHECDTGSIEYFRFLCPPGNGRGGKRRYGQDVTFEKSITLFVEGAPVEFRELDSHIGFPGKVIEVADLLIIASVAREGKTVVLHLSSGLDMYNHTILPFAISVVEQGQRFPIGNCYPAGRKLEGDPNRSMAVVKDGRVTRASSRFGIPSTLLQSVRSSWKSKGGARLLLMVSPLLETEENVSLSGQVELTLRRSMFEATNKFDSRFDVTCRSLPGSTSCDPFVFQMSVSSELVCNDSFILTFTIEPRIIMENKIPVPLCVKTPMPHTYGDSRRPTFAARETIHTLKTDDQIQVFTSGPSIAVTLRCAENPISGTSTDWMTGWVDLPLLESFRLPEPLKCIFPFSRRTADPLSLAGAWGSQFYICQGTSLLAESSASSHGQQTVAAPAIEVAAPLEDDQWRTFFITVPNYAVDHTGDLLVEQLESTGHGSLRRSASTPVGGSMRGSMRKSFSPPQQISRPFGAYGTHRRSGRLSLLPASDVPLRLVQLTMEGAEGLRRSAAFRVEDVSMCDGGVDSTEVKWANGKPSGYFAYRTLLDSSRSEIHFIPEYIVFNGSQSHNVRVRQPGGVEVVIAPLKIGPLRTHAQETATISVEFVDYGAVTAPMRVDALGLRVAVVKKIRCGTPIGSLALQTVLGARDSKLVVKLGELKFGKSNAQQLQGKSSLGSLDNDFLRFRFQCSELRVTLDEGRPIAGKNQAFFESALDKITEATSPANKSQLAPIAKKPRSTWVEARSKQNQSPTGSREDDPVCTIILHRFTIDWQRVFKEEQESNARSVSAERSQLSIVIHNLNVKDETPESPYPIVFDSSSNTSFFDLCVRFKGPIDSEIVKVDLFDLNLAHANGASQRIVINTSEDFVWKLLDLANRIVVAAGEFAGVDIELKWDEEHDGYAVDVRSKQVSFLDQDDTANYTPPQSDQLYHLARARVSPFSVVVSFKRTPQSSRYKKLSGVRGANIMNYFSRRLKFKIEKAELKFARYEARDMNGPPDRLIEDLTTVYLSRAKLKLVTLLSAASFQDWKAVAAREDGDDAYSEGDILRATGNVAGMGAGYVLRKAGSGLGHGVSTVTHAIGDGIENASDAIGVGAVGAGVNSLVSGVGDGLGNTLSGVGTGAGRVIRGAGQGVGQVFGGVAGGALKAGKGIARGVVSGDGTAVMSGLAEGAASAGTGIGSGVESLVTGTTEGVVSMGKGLFSGVRSVGMGITGAFAVCCPCCPCNDEDEIRNRLEPLLPRSNSFHEIV